MSAQCVTCDRPVPDTAYACTGCADRARRDLATVADLADAARAVASGQVRRGPAVHSGGGGSRLPLNLAAMARLDGAQTAITTWCRHVVEERGGNGPHSTAADRTGPSEGDPLGVAAQWLSGHLEWLRHRQEVDEALRDIAAAARLVRSLADGPPDRAIVGICECEKVLYARPGADVATCPGCQQRWSAPESREILRRSLDDTLLTAAEIATLSAIAAGSPTARQRVRKLINVWSGRGLVTIRGNNANGDPLYRFAEVEARLEASLERQAS